MSQKQLLTLRFILLASLLVAAPLTFAQNKSQNKIQEKTRATQSGKTSLHLVWPGQQGVLRYRLQVARDEQFKDIVFDRAVYGTEYLVTELTPGNYYWRVAPAVKETGTFTKPRLVVITGQPGSDTGTEINSTTTPPAAVVTGWRTTTGPVTLPLIAHLRSASSNDLVGVNSDGMVYGLDGTNGVALWTARFRPNAKQGEPTGNGGAATFTPILIDGRDGLTNVVVAFDGGVRAIKGSTGRELWRATLTNRPITGAIALPESGGAKTLLIASEKSTTLSILNPDNGKSISEVKLDAPVIADAAQFPLGGGNGVVFALEGGGLDVRSSTGERVRFVKMDTTITTPPLVVRGPRGTLVLVGTESGLISLSADDLKPTGRIATEGDAPSGRLTAADLDGDGTPEVILLTRRGRIAAIGTADGKIKWHNTGATDAASATFADLDKDGVMDVIVAGGQDFAHGFSGRDGSLIWRAEEDVKIGTQTSSSNQSRAIVTVRLGDGSKLLIVGTDAARTGLRAVELPNDSVKAAKE